MDISYYAIFQFDSDGICITFPDLPGCFTDGDTIAEGVEMAKEVLDLWLYGMDPKDLPSSTPSENIPVTENQQLFLISISMEIKDGKLFNPNVVVFE